MYETGACAQATKNIHALLRPVWWHISAITCQIIMSDNYVDLSDIYIK